MFGWRKNSRIQQYDRRQSTAGDRGAFNLLFCLRLSSYVWWLAVFCVDLQNDKENFQSYQTHNTFMK